MVPRKQVSARRLRRSGGNTIIESVFTMLPTFALIFCITDVGLMLFRWSTLQNAVREGARYAITFQQEADGEGGYFGQEASIIRVVEQWAMGLVRATDSPQHIFVKYYSQQDPYTQITGGAGNVPGNIVEVSVQNLSFSWMAPLTGSFGGSIPMMANTDPVSLAVYASDILGGLPPGVTSVPQ